jgi:hypothetical protein
MIKKVGVQIEKRHIMPVMSELLVSLFILFIISFLYYSFFGLDIFPYQENQIMFIYNSDYLFQYLSRPGGLLVYAGNFITQFYFIPLFGPLVLAALITLTAFVCYKIARAIYNAGPFLLAVSLIPTCILILQQSDYNTQIFNILGFLFVAVYFLFVTRSVGKHMGYLPLVIFPVFYYFAGGYAWIFAGLYITNNLLNGNKLSSILLIIIACITFIIFKEIIFFQSPEELIRYPAPLNFKSAVFFYILSVLFIFYPLVLKVLHSIKYDPVTYTKIFPYMGMILFSSTIFILSRLYNPEVSNLFKIEKLVNEEKWDDAIQYQEKIQSGNIIAQYYYNLALSETDQLCDRMFHARQDYGPNSIMVQWDSKLNINQIYRGAYFFYSIGLINEAHRWAFESMVMQGYRPGNIKMLIKTELINGNYRVALKYIDILKATLYYRRSALRYEKMLNHPELIRSDPDLGEKILLLPEEDFLIRLKDQQVNVLLMLNACPSNRKAFEYKVAWFMLEKNLQNVVNEIGTFQELKYMRLPEHIEEAVLLYRSTGQNVDIGNLNISNGSVKRFTQYKSFLAGRNGTGSVEDNFYRTFGNSLWFYFDKP